MVTHGYVVQSSLHQLLTFHHDAPSARSAELADDCFLPNNGPPAVQRHRNFLLVTCIDNFMGASLLVGPRKSDGLARGVFAVVAVA